MYFAWFRSTFLRFLTFLHIKEGGLNFCGEPVPQNDSIICPPFLYIILKALRTQILRQSLDFNAFCMILEYFSESLEISTN